MSGGRPAIAIAAVDVFPDMHVDAQFSQAPLNRRIARAKEIVRKELMQTVPKEARYNPLHSSDTPMEALEYLRTIDPVFAARSSKAAATAALVSQHPYPILRSFDGNRRRAKVELIDFRGQPAVCKTFRPTASRFLQRELLARKLAPDKNKRMIPQVLETGSNYFVMEYCQHDVSRLSSLRPLGSKQGLLPVSTILDCVDLIRAFCSQGYELVDFAPKNIILDKAGGTKVVDFEFFQRSVGPSCLENNFAWWGIPDDFRGDTPVGQLATDPYFARWFPMTGIPRALLIRIKHSTILKLIQLIGWLYLSAGNCLSAVRTPRKLHGRKRLITAVQPGNWKAMASPPNNIQKQAGTINSQGGTETKLNLAIADVDFLGASTVDYLRTRGILTVGDLLNNDYACLAEVGAQSNLQLITELQELFRLLHMVPGLRHQHAQLLAAAGYRSLDSIATADPTVMAADLLRFALTPLGKRILSGTNAPDLREVSRWHKALRIA